MSVCRPEVGELWVQIKYARLVISSLSLIAGELGIVDDDSLTPVTSYRFILVRMTTIRARVRWIYEVVGVMGVHFAVADILAASETSSTVINGQLDLI